MEKSLVSWFCIHGAAVKTQRLQVPKRTNLTLNECRDPLTWRSIGQALSCPRGRRPQDAQWAPKPSGLSGRFCAGDQAVEALVRSPLDYFSQVSHLLAGLWGPFSTAAPAERFRAPTGLCSAAAAWLPVS